MATFTVLNRPGQQPSAPLFINQTVITFATPADDYAAGGYALDLQNRIGAGRTILAAYPQGRIAATDVWDAQHWHHDADSDRLVVFQGRSRDTSGGWTPGQAAGARVDTVANLSADVRSIGTEVPNGTLMNAVEVMFLVFSY